MQKRNPVTVILLSLITFGIYQLYWFVVTRREMVKKGYKIPSIWWVLAPLLGFFGVALLQFLGRFVISSADVDTGSTVINLISSLVGLAAILAIIPVAIYWMWQYCKAVEGVTKRNFEASLAFFVWLLLAFFGVAFIWSGIAQDYFNKIGSRKT